MEVLAAACAVLVLIMRSRVRHTDVLTALAGVVSLAATAFGPRAGELSGSAALLGLVEMGALLTLIVVTARRAGRVPAVVPLALAVGVWVLRVDPPTSSVVLLGCASWFAAALGTAGVGLYLRSLDVARQRAVAETRAAARTLMAHELHDFVAHDVSEMLALASAGRVLSTGSRELTELLRGIEQSARSALQSMDRTLDLLDGRIDGRHPAPALSDIPDLVDRFATSFAATVHLDLDVPDEVARETGAAAYRVVLESLTNVRRHAPGASRVDVRVALRGAELAVEVTDDGTGIPSGKSRGGRGLSGLAERVSLLGGSLTSGRGTTVGWCTAALLPVRPPRALDA